MGVPTASVSPYIAQVQTLLKESGLVYHMGANGTSVGEWSLVPGAVRANASLQRGVGRMLPELSDRPTECFTRVAS